jgi:hypothetical protein
MKPSRRRILTLLASAAAALPGRPQAGGAAGYDPKADPMVLLAATLTEARTANRKVLIIAGGDWCRWCLVLQRFIDSHPDVKAAMEQAFVVVKVYYGEANRNPAFFARLPKARGYPFFWVLRNDGSLLSAVDTGPLESGRDSYDKERFLAFVGQMQGI